MALAPTARRTVAVVAATALAGAALTLVTAPAQAATLARVSAAPAPDSLVAAPAVIAASYTNFLSPLSTIVVTRGGAPVCSAPGPALDAPDRRTISCSPVGAQSSGTYDVAIEAIDTAVPPNHLSDSYSFDVDAAIKKPTVTIAPDEITTAEQASVLVFGSTDPAATVSVALDDADAGTAAVTRDVTADDSGVYGVELDASSLADGILTATVEATDPLGNTATGTATATKDTVAPALVSSVPADGTSTQQVDAVSATFSEEVVEGASLVLTDGDGNQLAGDVDVEGETVTLTPAAALGDGAYLVSLAVTDALGNSGEAGFGFVVDSAAPGAPTVEVPESFNGDLLVTGLGEAGTRVDITVTTAGGLVPLPLPVAEGTGTVQEDGSYAVTVDVPDLAPDADYAVTATLTDAAGNTSPAGGPAITRKDSAAPRTPVLTVTPDPIGSASVSDVAVSVATDPGTQVTLEVVDTDETRLLLGTDDGSDGSYRFAGLDVSELADGVLTFVATATDGAGNSATGQKSATKDTAAPQITGLAVTTDPINAANADEVEITGVTEAGSSVTVALTDGADTVTGTAQLEAGDESFTVVLDARPLADGPLTATATATDAAGNVGPEAGPALATKDVVAPLEPTQEQGHVTSANASSYAVFGVTSPGAELKVTISDEPLPDPSTDDVIANVTADDSGAYTTGGLDVRGLNDGALSIRVVASDDAGNTSTSSQVRTKDTAAPAKPTVTITSNPVVPSGGGVPATVSGALAPADRLRSAGLTVVLAVTDGTEVVEAEAAPGPTGDYDAVIDVAALADGPIRATALVRDAVGNVSPQETSAAVQKNTLALQRVSTTPVDGSVIRTAPVVSATYNEVLDGDGRIVLRSRSGNQVAGTTSSPDERSIAFTPAAALTAAGSPYTATLTVADRIGESSVSSLVFTLSSTAAPTLQVAGPISSATAGALVASGVTEPGATVSLTVTDAASPAGSVTAEPVVADGDGAYRVEDLDVSGLADGILTVTARATFQDGVVSDEATASVLKDTVGPVLVTSSPAAGAEVAPPDAIVAQFDEQVQDGATATLDSSGGGDVVVGEDGRTVTFTPAEPVVDGAHSVTFEVTDLVGNAATAGFGFVVDATAPVEPVVTVPATVNAAEATSFVVAVSEVEPGDVVHVAVSGPGASDVLDSGVVDAAGRIDFALDVSGFEDGVLVAVANATDPQDRTGPAGSDSSLKDTVAPVAPAVALPPRVTGAGQDAVPVSGTAEPGTTAAVTLTDEDAATPHVLVQALAGPDGTYQAVADVRDLADGVLTATATSTDAAGNRSGEGDAATTTKDTVGPSAPTAALTDPVSAADADRAAVSGVAALDTALVDVVVDDADGATPALRGSTVPVADGAYELVLDVTGLKDGTLSATVTPVDGFGNRGAATVDTATKDTRAPQLLTATPVAGSTGTAPADVRFAFDEDLGAAPSVAVLLGGSAVAGTTTLDGARTVVFTPSSAFAAGDYAASTQVTDRVGNPGSGSTTFTVSPASTDGGDGTGDGSPSPSPTASASASASPSPSAGASPSASPTVSPTVSPTASPDGSGVAPAPERAEGVTRFGGTDRFLTAAAVSAGSFPGRADDVFVVTGMTWPDALSAGPAAAAAQAPVLPVRATSIPAAISDEIDRLSPRRAWVIGGAGVVSDAVLADLRERGISVTRISGRNRYETAAAVAERFFPGAEGAYYASGEDYPDALGGGAAAASRGWPLLLTLKDSLPAATPVIDGGVVLGGEAAVSESVRNRLAARRVGGTDRYSTAAAIARDAFGSSSVVYLATGLNFPDALAGAPAAARDGAPLLLAAGTCVTAATKDAVTALGSVSRVVLGGRAAVSDEAADLQLC